MANLNSTDDKNEIDRKRHFPLKETFCLYSVNNTAFRLPFQ
jgi:hypothetical protein